MEGSARWLLLVSALAVGAGATVWTVRRGRPDTLPVTLRWVATARQFGPVGYRDPVGAISADGRWIAYSEGRFLRMRAIDGGPILDLPAGEAQIRTLAWNPDSREALTDGYQTQAGLALYDRESGTRRAFAGGSAALRMPAWSPDGRSLAAIVNDTEGQQLRIVSRDGAPLESRRLDRPGTFPAWTPAGEIACISSIDRRSRITIPCGARALRIEPDLDAYGPFVFSPDGRIVYAGLANASGTLDLWAIPASGGRARRLTSFARDTYAPTIAADGRVMFKVQNYRTIVATSDATGGPSSPIALFQSETPSWDPTGKWIGVTYGTWRRFADDAHYPDIAQDAGIIGADAASPSTTPASIVHASASEDQSLCWSPNGRWIAFHSHKDGSDDIWLRASTEHGDAPARRISFLGRGAETGWPRWSPDGRWIMFDGASRVDRRPSLYVVAANQDTGTTGDVNEIRIEGADAIVSHAEWLPDSAQFVAIGKESPGRHVIFVAPREGGPARVVLRFGSEHDAPGLGVSPDGRDVAFIAPAPDGFFQVFRMPVAGGTPTQVTRDPSDKTQPAWSPDGRRLAFAVWSYDAQFWTIDPPR